MQSGPHGYLSSEWVSESRTKELLTLPVVSRLLCYNHDALCTQANSVKAKLTVVIDVAGVSPKAAPSTGSRPLGKLSCSRS